MKRLGAFIDGTAPLAKQAHFNTEGHFKDRGYYEVTPYQAEQPPRDMLKSFYERDATFALTNDTLKQLRTVYKVSEKYEVQFAASFFVMELDQHLISYLEVIKTEEGS